MVKKLKDRPHLRVFCINRYANYWFASNWRLRTRFFFWFSLSEKWSIKAYHENTVCFNSCLISCFTLGYYIFLLVQPPPTSECEYVWMVGGGGRQKEHSRTFVKIELRIKFLEVWQKKSSPSFFFGKKISSVRNFLWKWEGFMVKKNCKIEFIYQKIKKNTI